MGEYTPTQRYYLIDGDELVNVEQDLNYNWRRADERIKPLIEIQATDEPTISAANIPKDVGFKWFKTYTNSWYFYNGSNTVTTDVNSVVADWSATGIAFQPGYGSVNLEESRIAYCIQDGFVHLRGRLCRNGTANEIPAGTVTNFMTLPAEAYPARSKYFTVYGGNAASGDFQCARIFVPQAGSADLNLEFMKYGGSASSAQERYLSLNGVFYGLDD